MPDWQKNISPKDVVNLENRLAEQLSFSLPQCSLWCLKVTGCDCEKAKHWSQGCWQKKQEIKALLVVAREVA